MSPTFKESRFDVDGASIRCFEAGQGELVVALHGETDAAPTPLDTLLAQKCRVVVLGSSGFSSQAPRDASRLIARAARHLGLEHYSLIASAAITVAGLHHALEAAAQVEALILVSPSGTIGDLEPRLGDIKPPTLILVGTADKPASPGRRYADRVPDSYFMVVYDAGPAMETERPAALFEAIADFIERRGRFVLERRDTALSP